MEWKYKKIHKVVEDSRKFKRKYTWYYHRGISNAIHIISCKNCNHFINFSKCTYNQIFIANPKIEATNKNALGWLHLILSHNIFYTHSVK